MFGKRLVSTAPHVEEHLVARAQARVDRPRDLVPGRELVHEALAAGVDDQRALAAHGLGHQEAVELSLRAQRGRVELHELEVGQRRRPPRARGTGRRRRLRAGWWCGSRAPRPRRCRARSRAPGSRPSRSRRRRSGRRATISASAERALVHVDARVGGDQLGQARGQMAAGGAAARVHHAAPVVAALERQLQRAVRLRDRTGCPAPPARARGPEPRRRGCEPPPCCTCRGPAASVSATCRPTSSSGAIAAARPPCAQ